MRINIYAEELTDETELITKVVNDDEFGERTFYGVRMYLHSPDVLHHSAEDDDRSAITFWIPWTKAEGQHPYVVGNVLRALDERVTDATIAMDRAGDKIHED